MKALTIYQPFAKLILIGEKRVENRTWGTRHRGDLLIHAGKSKAFLGEAILPDGAPLEFGAIIAKCFLSDCADISIIRAGRYDAKYPWLRDHQHAIGPFCWILKYIEPIEPIPCNGKQGLWEYKGKIGAPL